MPILHFNDAMKECHVLPMAPGMSLEFALADQRQRLALWSSELKWAPGLSNFQSISLDDQFTLTSALHGSSLDCPALPSELKQELYH